MVVSNPIGPWRWREVDVAKPRGLQLNDWNKQRL
jgi:hypothetical protein